MKCLQSIVRKHEEKNKRPPIHYSYCSMEILIPKNYLFCLLFQSSISTQKFVKISFDLYKPNRILLNLAKVFVWDFLVTVFSNTVEKEE